MNVTLEKQLPIALVKLTQTNKMRWATDDSSGLLFDGGSVDGHIYESKINGKTISLFRFTYDFTNEYDEVFRDFSYRLVILNSDGIAETEIDDKYGLEVLYGVVREACHEVSDWVKEVVSLAKNN